MSTTPTPQRPRTPGQAPQAPAAGAVAIDPAKLLHKYKFVLVASVIIGVFVGGAAHVLLSKFAPVYTSHIIFACSPAEESIEIISVATVDETEMERFMGTQVANIKSQLILSKVISDPRLPSLAPKWSSQYLQSGNINTVEALKDFEKMVRVHAIPKTFLIRLAVSTKDKVDAAGLVSLVKDAYRGNLDSMYKRDILSRRTAIRDMIEATDSSIEELSGRKLRMVREGRIDSVDSDRSTSADQLRLINSELLGIQQTVEAMEVIRATDQAQLQRDTGIEYDSTLRATIEDSGLMLSFKQELKSLQTMLAAIQIDGIQPGHRQYKQLSNQITAHERKIENTREELLREAFEARVQSTVQTIQQLQAQESELLTQKEDLEEKLTELTRISEVIADIDRQIEAKIAQMGEQEQAFSDLQAAAALSSAQRVSVIEDATVPELPTFPVLIIMIPAGVFVIVGLTVGCIVLFEMLDQRIKSASDIRLIPRTHSLGIIMDASEDHTTPKSVYTAFASSPGSVYAEHFRQLRTGITSAMNRGGHRSMLVIGTMPGSGSTTVVTNLAHSCIATQLNTLVIDANFRRPNIHAALGIQDGPGLGDVLTDQKTLESCIVKTNDGLNVLTAGTASNRQIELLTSRQMKQLLQTVHDQYDMILIDVAPAIVAGDAMILANMVDASMLVVQAMSEKRGQVARISRELGETKSEFIGVLVNKVKSAAGGYMRKNIQTTFDYHNNSKKKSDKSNPKDTAA